ncbi:hypothetical protein HELRODRAFT_189411 [Helobdella robusta]|uniref:Uncharacterized protein n=1 Tax=Helobdella robusta TaxID=6412 RepID=T1FR14_HELRO|nr:hypothetical protein HELRODRAFT_189411 [Helobdella robusta]ESN94494.1 hypothetical protein HELRODRAFT_189411 [Helobdella robusta]
MQLTAVGLNSNVIHQPVGETEVGDRLSVRMCRDDSRSSLPGSFIDAPAKSLQFPNKKPIINPLQNLSEFNRCKLAHSKTHGNFVQHHKLDSMFYISDSSPSLSPDEVPCRSLFKDFLAAGNFRGETMKMKNLIISEKSLEETAEEGKHEKNVNCEVDSELNNRLNISNTPKKKNKLARMIDKTLTNKKNK